MQEPIPFSFLISDFDQTVAITQPPNGSPTAKPFAYVVAFPVTATMTVNGIQAFSQQVGLGMNVQQDLSALKNLPPGQYQFTLSATNASGLSDQVSGVVLVTSTAEGSLRSPGHVIVSGVDIDSGNLALSYNDLTIKNRGLSLGIDRSYNSQSAGSFGPFGYGWGHNYQILLSHDSTKSLYAVSGGDGSGQQFSDSAVTGANGAQALPPYHSTLGKNPDGSFDYFTKSHIQYHFDGAFEISQNQFFNLSYMGNLDFMQEPNGNKLQMSYDGQGRLSSVADSSNRSLQFTYEAANAPFVGAASQSPATAITCLTKGQYSLLRNKFIQSNVSQAFRITKITDSSGVVITYSYDQNGNLAT
ncbi:MAG: DUF6531 domain-containing protein, partial [Blastocatellia bacterium]